MAIYRKKSFNFLKHIALKVNQEKCIFYIILISYSNRFIPVSLQISIDMYKKNVPYTYNTDNNVIVIVYDNNNIFFIPYSTEFEEILIEENINRDINIFIPGIKIDNLEGFTNRFIWKMALLFCK